MLILPAPYASSTVPILDALIIGGGPAGLTAAIYLRRFLRDIAILDKGHSRLDLIPATHNFPGFPHGIRGSQLLENLRCQLANHGGEVTKGEITGLRREGNVFVAHHDGRQIYARTVLLATGIADAGLPIENWHEAMASGAVRLCPVCDGFDVLAPDFYDGHLPTTEGEAAKAMNALDLLDAVARIGAGAAFLRARERSNGKVGVTGFCLGGAITFAAACHVPGLAGLVPFYGIPAPEKVDWSKVDAPIEAHFAKRDQWATVEKAEAIRKTLTEQGKSMVLHVYDAEHAFVNDTRPVHHPENAKLAWERTVAFFRRVL